MKIPSTNKGIAFIAQTLILFCVSLLSGSRSLMPLIWNDSTSYIASSLGSVLNRTLQVSDGVNVGYVAIMAYVLGHGGGLSTLVLLQHIAWALTVSLCGYTLFKVTNAKWGWSLVFAILLLIMASYPGIQIYNNLVLAESLYTVAITCALCFTLLAWDASSSRSVALAYLLTGLFMACFAALTKAQGLAPFLVITVVGIVLAYQKSRKIFLPYLMGLIVALALLGIGHSIREESLDRTSALFGSKTLFCSHLDLILKSQVTASHARDAFGPATSVMLDQLHADLTQASGNYVTLGFYSDDCQFDKTFDSIAIDAFGGDVARLARWYRQAFVSAVAENPGAYLRKVFKQLSYGLKMSIPPHALDKTISESTERKAIAIDMLEKSGIRDSGLQNSVSVEAPFVAKYAEIATVGYRVFSLLVGLSLLGAFVGFFHPKLRQERISAYASLAALVWFSQVGSIALTHTLDVWRYIVPVVPAGVLALALTAYMFWLVWGGSANYPIKNSG